MFWGRGGSQVNDPSEPSVWRLRRRERDGECWVSQLPLSGVICGEWSDGHHIIKGLIKAPVPVMLWRWLVVTSRSCSCWDTPQTSAASLVRHYEKESGGSSGLDVFSIAIGWGTKDESDSQIFLHREEETLIIYQFWSLESCGVQHHWYSYRNDLLWTLLSPAKTDQEDA